MTSTEREVLRRFFAEPFLEALLIYWNSSRPLWYGEAGQFSFVPSRAVTDSDTKLWRFEHALDEFQIVVYTRSEPKRGNWDWNKELFFHGPWTQRFQGLITMLGAQDVLMKRRCSRDLCVHALA